MHTIEFIEMLSEKKFLLELALILGSAALGGYFINLLKMPKVLGQIIVGIILGPTVLGWIHGSDEFIHTMSEIGVIFLMFLAGLETDLKELKSSGKGATVIALGGVAIPMGLGAIIPYFFFRQYIPDGTPHQQVMYALYVGTILTATSVSISVSVLRDMKQLASKQGISILGAAIIDDVLGIILLAAITGMVNPGSGASIGGLILRIGMFFVLSIILGTVVSKLITKYAHGSVWTEKVITFAIILCFMFSFVSEIFKIASITGAYIAGVIFSATPYRHKVSQRIQVLAYSLFTPVFFVSIGLKVELTSEVFQYWQYGLVIVLIAVFGKIIGCGLGAVLSGFKGKQVMQIGVGMIARAEVALIVASQGMSRGVISDATFTSVVLLVVISTLVTPPLLKALFAHEKPVEDVYVDEIQA